MNEKPGFTTTKNRRRSKRLVFYFCMNKGTDFRCWENGKWKVVDVLSMSFEIATDGKKGY